MQRQRRAKGNRDAACKHLMRAVCVGKTRGGCWDAGLHKDRWRGSGREGREGMRAGWDGTGREDYHGR